MRARDTSLLSEMVERVRTERSRQLTTDTLLGGKPLQINMVRKGLPGIPTWLDRSASRRSWTGWLGRTLRAIPGRAESDAAAEGRQMAGLSASLPALPLLGCRSERSERRTRCRTHLRVEGVLQPRTGTAMERSPVPLQKWLVAALLMIRGKGVSSLRPAGELGTTRTFGSSWPRAPPRHEAAMFGIQRLTAISGSGANCT